MILDTNHTTLIVSDLNASRRFYGEALGMQAVPRPASFDFDGAWFRAGSAELHLIRAAETLQPPGDIPPMPNQPGGPARARHIGFTVPSLEDCVKRLAAHNIPIVAGPRPRGDGPMQLYVYDPDGHLIEFTTRT